MAGLSLGDTALGNITSIAQAGNLKLNYSATLYNSKADGDGCFYGRTYISDDFKLTSSPSGDTLDMNSEDFLYLNTNYIEKTSVLIVELILTRTTAGM